MAFWCHPRVTRVKSGCYPEHKCCYQNFRCCAYFPNMSILKGGKINYGMTWTKEEPRVVTLFQMDEQMKNSIEVSLSWYLEKWWQFRDFGSDADLIEFHFTKHQFVIGWMPILWYPAFHIYQAQMHNQMGMGLKFYSPILLLENAWHRMTQKYQRGCFLVLTCTHTHAVTQLGRVIGCDWAPK